MRQLTVALSLISIVAVLLYGRHACDAHSLAAVSADWQALSPALHAPKNDGARRTMQLATAILNRSGIEAKFVSTGPLYHQLPADLDVIIRDAVRWIRDAS